MLTNFATLLFRMNLNLKKSHDHLKLPEVLPSPFILDDSTKININIVITKFIVYYLYSFT
jgi:hypothetical protein